MNSTTNIMRRAVALIAIMLVLSGCMPDQCIDADDFGFPRFTVSARYDPSEIVGTGENEIAPWRDTQFTVNGEPLTIVIKNWSNVTDDNDTGDVSAWSPWYGNSGDGDTKGSALNSINKRFIECTWDGNAGGYGLYSSPETRYAMITNAPCLLHKGVGLYALIATQENDPNANISATPPQGITFHVGDPNWQAAAGYTMFDVNTLGQVYPAGGLVYQYTGADDSGQAVNVDYYDNSKLYFKILDRMHGDNSGQYRVIIKSGINDPYPDPFQYITALVKAQFFGDPNDVTNSTGVVKNIYLQVINNLDYKRFVGAILTLYVMFTAFSFLVGTLEITHTELITRIIKVGIVAALLDPSYGWTFFYNYLFVFFIDGTSELISIIQQAANTGGGSSSLLTMLTAPETVAKVLSLLLTSPTGIIYIVVYLVLLVFYVFISFRAAALYVSALIMIGMIIIMGPIFLCFMLFEFTKGLFENWIKQLMYYTLQPIILLASIAFMSMMIRHEIYSTLGFRICRQDFPDLGPLFTMVDPSDNNGSGTPTSIFFWFFPAPMTGAGFSNTMAVIPVPEAHAVTVDTATISTTSSTGIVSAQSVAVGYQCAAYECNESRYVDLPFLDPGLPHDMEKRSNFLQGLFVQFENLIYLAILLYLMHRFNETAISISKSLNNVVNSAAPEHAAEAAAHGIIAPIQGRVEREVHKATAPARAALREILFQAENATVGKLARKWDESRTNSVAKDALGKGAQQSVLDRVKENHDLDRSDIKPTAKKDYQDAVSQKLQSLCPDRSKEEIDQLADRALTLKKSSENATWRRDHSEDAVKDLLAQATVGFGENDPRTTFNSLDAAKRQDIINLLKQDSGGRSLSDLAQEAKKAEEFQAAYIQEFQAMSKEGHGVLGKRSSAFRAYTEYKQELNKPGTGFFSDSSQAARGDSLNSGYDSLKNALSGGLLEGDTMQYNYENSRLQTYQEEIAERYRVLAQKDLQKEIDSATSLQGKDILRPENLANLKKISPALAMEYENLANEKIKYDVYATLASPSTDADGNPHNPVLMGERYMQEKMTDKQFREAIETTIKLEEEHIRNDRYLTNKRRMDFKDDQDVTDIMNKRDAAIRDEFDKHIALLNEYRQKAGMPVYDPRPPKPEEKPIT